MLEEATHVPIEKGPRSVNPLLIPTIMPNAVSCLVSIETGARGPVLTSTLACASGRPPRYWRLTTSFSGEKRTRSSPAVPNWVVTPLALASMARMGALSQRNDEPTRASCPFDAKRDGFVYGEGSAILILESEDRAGRAGPTSTRSCWAARAHRRCLSHHGARSRATRAVRPLRGASEAAGVQPCDVDVIYAHGTSTPLNDETETAAIKQVFNDHANRLAITSTKSMVGHIMGGAGSISAFGAVKTLQEGIIPPTINYEYPDPKCDLDYVPNQRAPPK